VPVRLLIKLPPDLPVVIYVVAWLAWMAGNPEFSGLITPEHDAEILHYPLPPPRASA
jgi:hypothetical protein